MKLWKEGWFQDQTEPSGVTTLRNPKVYQRRGVMGARLTRPLPHVPCTLSVSDTLLHRSHRSLATPRP